MLVQEVFSAGHVILRLEGELDLGTAETFRRAAEEALERHGSYRLVLNLAGVSFIDSSGLGAILGRYRRIAQRQGRMALVAPPENVRAMLELSGVFKVIPIYDSEQKALAG